MAYSPSISPEVNVWRLGFSSELWSLGPKGVQKPDFVHRWHQLGKRVQLGALHQSGQWPEGLPGTVPHTGSFLPATFFLTYRWQQLVLMLSPPLSGKCSSGPWQGAPGQHLLWTPFPLLTLGREAQRGEGTSLRSHKVVGSKTSLGQGLAGFFCKEKSSKYFRLCRLLGSLFQPLTSAVVTQSSHQQYTNGRMQLCSQKILFMDTKI